LGSDAYENAAEWLIWEFKKLGIEAHLEEAGEVPVGFNRGPWFGRMVGPESMNLHFVTPSCTSGTAGLVRGHVVIEPNSEAELNRIKGKVKGAWVLVGGKNSGWPIYLNAKEDSVRAKIKAENALIEEENQKMMAEARAKGERLDQSKMKPTKSHPGLYAHELLELGALGFIQAGDLPLRALYDRPMMADMTVTFDKLPKHADIKLDAAQYDIIYKKVKNFEDVQLEFDIRNHFKLGPIKFYNVVATIPGTKYPYEKVIISGHLDAFDSATGAVDCGTGISAMLGAAHLIAKSGVKPKRTIQFVGFAGEEFGLWGAQAYCKTHAKELDKIVNLFNRDGGPTACTGINVPEAWYDDMVKICAPIKNLWDFEFTVTKTAPRRKVTAMGGTDASVFGMKGVPCVELRNEDYKGYGFNYQEIWHTENDYLNKSFQDYMEQAAAATAVVASGIATLDKALPREGVYEK
ncbi:MAG: M20/M25/M40 family metallo-hydrolase, partial [Bacteroidaceae bacterium]|nr:M20/M25/M40 family metallo-hydrolase [Bacteroidaceae bacterium]